MNTRIRKIALLCLLGFVIGTGAAWLQVAGDTDGARYAAMEPAAGDNGLAGADIGGSFTLTDHHGNTVTDKDYAGQYKLIFFGFTYCPDVCPAGLKKMTAVLNTLGETATAIQPLFVTIDPARDTPEVMKQYLESYHPQFVGLTGTEEQIEAIESDYKVYAAKVEDETLSDYTMNHSSYIFLMSPDGAPLSMFSSEDTIEDMTAEIRKYMQRTTL